MTRLIPGHDAPDVESSQVAASAVASAGALARALARALEDPSGAVVPDNRVSLRSVPVGSGVAPEWDEPTCAPAAVSAVADIPPTALARWADTPEAVVVRPIGPDGAPSGGSSHPSQEVPIASPADAESATPVHPADLADAADITSTLWADYLTTRSRSGRDRLVVHYRGLVRGVAGKLAGGLPNHVDVSDLVQVGMFGLLDAVERFDPEREVRFESYAAQRIRGAMLDELRAQDWVPRSARSRHREIERTRERLESVRGRTVSDREVAEELRLGLRELRGSLLHRQLVSVEALETGWTGPVSLAELVPDDTAPDPAEVAEHAETVRELVVAVGGLGERDQEVVRLYYLENRTLAEIGRLLGVTESRVCQLHSRLVTRLRSRLRETVAG
ncbi:FliA/WhiG family RNA polymerase sigma factor [Pseudonocardia xishanensis]|uniref:RNA polymerase sigma factor n=1 Tax=Pseudonocardia xishanensis TaxID=630995 RepID=A0ABP8RW06_9PSEU